MKNLIDLHLHLDGSLSANNVQHLCKMQNIDIPANIHSLLTAPSNCRDLNDYLKCFDFPLSLLQTEEAITQSILTLCRELEEIGLIYAEIRFAPQLHTRLGLTQKKVVLAACKAIQQSPLKTNLILCSMRGSDNQIANEETLKLCCGYIGQGICGCDLAGAEALFPTKYYKHLFEMAVKEKIPFTIHAGEADGAGSINDAINMGAHRIGHGVRAIEDENTIKLLTKYNIPIEMCPTSNLNTKVYDDIKDYPLPYYINQGVLVTVNSDNMSVSNTTVKKELELINSVFGISSELLLTNAAKAAFCTDNDKELIINKVQKKS